MGGYYSKHLVGPDLQRVYEVASPRIRRYLRAETGYLVKQLRGSGDVLELGCGFGRILREIAPHVRHAVGIDIVPGNLRSAASYLESHQNCDLARMNAVHLGFRDAQFDATICVQNGISAFGVDRARLVGEAVRVTSEGGRVLFSTYSPRIWADRVEWFRSQARAGLIGAVDESQTRGGTIVCEDGLRLTTVSATEFRALFRALGQSAQMREVDGSSLFAVARKRAPQRPPSSVDPPICGRDRASTAYSHGPRRAPRTP